MAGAAYSKKVTELCKGWLTAYRNRSLRANAKASLTVRMTIRADTKVGVSDPRIRSDCGSGLTNKSYPGDNRLVASERSQRRRGSAPRCRLIVSWRCSSFQGLGCSPIKTVRELGSERRETVRSLSGVGVRKSEKSCS